MIPKVYEKDITQSSQTLCAYLPDCISCTVTEELNSVFELTLEYPSNGSNREELKIDRVIEARASLSTNNQLFRIYRITKPMNGIVTVYAQHISYDLANIAVKTIAKDDMLCSRIMNKVLDGTEFSCSTTFSTSRKFRVYDPTSVRSVLLGDGCSVLNKWRGEFEFDNWAIYYTKNRGQDRNVSIDYGKNLISLDHDTDATSAYSHMMPYVKINDEYLFLDDKVMKISDTTEFDREKDVIVDVTDANYWESTDNPYYKEHKYKQQDVSLITQDELKAAAEEYLDSISTAPVPSITVEFEPNELFDTVYMGDTVSVNYLEYGITAKAEVTKTEYNTLLERYNSVTLGECKTSVTDSISEKIEKVDEKTEKVDAFQQVMDEAIANATAKIQGTAGGYVLMRTNDDEIPYEICIMDNSDIAQAKNIWRWNLGGLGFSSTGYYGSFGTAITGDGSIVADYITTGTLNANRIRAGSIESYYTTSGGKELRSYWDLDSGNIDIVGKITASSGAIGSWTISDDRIASSRELDSAGNIGKACLLNLSGNDKAFFVSYKDAETEKTTYPFYVNYDGSLVAKKATIEGAITATSLTLSGKTVSYKDGDDTKTADFTAYIAKNGTIGDTPAEGSTGFKVNSDGLLTASNAIIYGTLYASKGNIGGFQILTSDNVNGAFFRYYGDSGMGSDGSFYIMPQGYKSTKSIAGSSTISGWVLTAGKNFGVTNQGETYASNFTGQNMTATENFQVHDNICLYVGGNTNVEAKDTDHPIVLQYAKAKSETEASVRFGVAGKPLVLCGSSITFSAPFYTGNLWVKNDSTYKQVVCCNNNVYLFGNKTSEVTLVGSEVYLENNSYSITATEIRQAIEKAGACYTKLFG